jgi:hypothetical protein
MMVEDVLVDGNILPSASEMMGTPRSPNQAIVSVVKN